MSSPDPFYNVQHSPVGAFASFTLGSRGAAGGLGLELGRPANESVYIGLETPAGGRYEALPFYAGTEDASREYDPNAAVASGTALTPFSATALRRELGLATDTWQAGDLRLTVYSRYGALPEPGRASRAALRDAYVPALLAELTIDNRAHARPRTAFFGFKGDQPDCNMRVIEGPGPLRGVGQGLTRGIFTTDPRAEVSQAFTIEKILAAAGGGRPLNYGIGNVAALLLRVPARRRVTFRLALTVYRAGVVTAGLPSVYYYTRLFPDLEGAARFALERGDALRNEARAADRRLTRSRLNAAQRWQLAQAMHSYHGSTQLLWAKGRPFWIVNEGAYRMMNTFDLTVDQLFLEVRQHPWTVRNVLDWFRERYAYTDRTRGPGDSRDGAGGISFAHDMGVANVFSPRGISSYEQPGLHGCFSHMTHEELVNWVLCALVYLCRTGDLRTGRRWRGTLEACLRSMANRDDPSDAARIGIMRRDSSRCEGGSEITTYDSLDPSLGQARGNLYLAIKCWAAYVGLASVRPALGTRFRALAARQAERAARSIAGQFRADGEYLPALLDHPLESRILPIVEGLVFPFELGRHDALDPDGIYGPMIRAIRRHAQSVLVPGQCLFPDGGIKLSSSSENSWLSKVYLCQFVLREVLGLRDEALHRRADEAHQRWLLHPAQSCWAWSDQMMGGVACGSKYYPRGVTSVLWLEETRGSARSAR